MCICPCTAVNVQCRIPLLYPQTRRQLACSNGDVGVFHSLERPSPETRQAIVDLEFQVENIKMIVLRQKSIKGFFIEPSNAYVNAEAQLQVLSSQLQLLGSGIKVTQKK